MKIRVLIVDDSPFSQAIIGNALSPELFEVCGSAETGQEALVLYKELQPDVVTMDITMTDMNGMECSKALMEMDSKAKIVVLSSLKHDSLIAQGKLIGIYGFLQKPVDTKKLNQVLLDAYQDNRENEDWQGKLLEEFFKEVEVSFYNITRLNYKTNKLVEQEENLVLHGLAAIVGLTGLNQGRMILNCSMDSAEKLTKKLLKRDASENDIIHCLTELTNIICGNIVSKFNNNCSAFELDLTPPSVLFGESINIISQKFKTSGVSITTDLGVFNISIGFIGGMKKWI